MELSGLRTAVKLIGGPIFLEIAVLLLKMHEIAASVLVDKSGYFYGRGRRLRTLGLRFWRPPLYQLSYSPVSNLVDRQGLEPRTDRL